MQKVKSLVTWLILFVVFSILGVIAGFAIGNVVVFLENEGGFSAWKLLGGSLRFEQIIDATSQSVWAMADDGKLYSWDSDCYWEPKCEQWIESKDIPVDLHDFLEQPMEKARGCESRDYIFFRRPPGIPVECARGWLAGPEFGAIAYYALLTDGKIWSWEQSSSMIFDIVVLLFFSFGGLILGIITFIIFMTRRRMKAALRAL